MRKTIAPLITSPSNPRIKAFRLLMRQGEADSQGRIPVEGVKLVKEAMSAGLSIEVMYMAENRFREKSLRRLADSAQEAELVLVDDRTFASMVETDSPQGVAALVRLKEAPWELVSSGAPLLLVAWQMQDPGNLGTLIRSADAFGVTAILFASNCVNPYNQKVIRSSAGSIFRVPCLEWEESESLLSKLQRLGFRILATSSHSGTDFRRIDYRGPAALFIGNEGRGLPGVLIQGADAQVRIPMARTESLNAAVAASIILAESWRQRSL